MADLNQEYLDGASLSQIAVRHGIPKSTLRFKFLKDGILRDRKAAIRLAGSQGRMARSDDRAPISEQGRKNMSAAKRAWADANAIGICKKTDGYVEYTRGPHKGRSVHVVLMEERLGRHLLPDECVHHIDGDRHNNDLNNLALVTWAAHARLHRFEERLSGTTRERINNGRFA